MSMIVHNPVYTGYACQMQIFVCGGPCITSPEQTVYATPSAEEDAVHEVFRLNNLYYPVNISTEEAPPLLGVPWIRPSDFLGAMAKMNDLSHVLGGYSLDEAKDKLASFWSKFRAICPEHQLWADVDSKKKDIHKCIPLFLHGDEGVTYKKGGVLVVSFQGAFGWGSSKRGREMEENYRAMGEGIPLNFLKTGFQTRMLIYVIPKEYMGSMLLSFNGLNCLLEGQGFLFIWHLLALCRTCMPMTEGSGTVFLRIWPKTSRSLRGMA